MKSYMAGTIDEVVSLIRRHRNKAKAKRKALRKKYNQQGART